MGGAATDETLRPKLNHSIGFSDADDQSISTKSQKARQKEDKLSCSAGMPLQTRGLHTRLHHDAKEAKLGFA
jgi:hypothetical protein